METIREFQRILEKFGITTTVRDSMGRSVKSACGQLWFEKVKDKKKEEEDDEDD
jgi:adenine C2-methylase RlmN of 23S rRNA A2503 and tRNA A37